LGNAGTGVRERIQSEAFMGITTGAVQILNGYGYMQEFPGERMISDAKLMAIGGGTSEL